MSDSGYLIDTSVWVALAFPTHSHHQDAVDAFTLRSAARPAVFCRSTQQSVLRVITTPAVLRQYAAEPLTNRDAWVVFTRFLELPHVTIHEEPPALDAIWQRLAVRSTASSKVWMDAYLAAFAIVGGYQFITTDKGFKQYEGLDLILLDRDPA